MTEKKKDYKQQIKELLSHYKDGQNVFINAPDWDYTLERAKGSEDLALPESWLELADKVISIIAHEKYDLNTYPNTIEIIDSDAMLEAYTKVGMPVGYDHWSFGKQRVSLDQNYQRGAMGLAYEIVINTDPAIAYLMEENTKTMQMLVIAHASYGHNSFFKNNHMFKQFTKPGEIVGDLRRLASFIHECEERFGEKEVERLLDACHALQSHGVDRVAKPKRRTAEEEGQRRARLEEARRQNVDVLMDSFKPKTSTTDAFNKDHIETSSDGEENLLQYIATYAPHLEEWQREIIRGIGEVSQYFYPQKQTQVMNEGWASFWHHTIMNDLYDLDLIDEGMQMEFMTSHTGVVFQPEFDQPYYSGINPYALGFEMFHDIKRICLNPTDEDKKYFPEIAGQQDWLTVIKGAMMDYKDESFIEQFLSPNLIRKFRFFSITDDDLERDILVSAIHDESGYDKVREKLASQYRIADKEPRIEIDKYNYRGDRSLTLKHTMYDRKPLEESQMKEVLKHVFRLWKHPVKINSVDDNGRVENSMRCPPEPQSYRDKDYRGSYRSSPGF